MRAAIFAALVATSSALCARPEPTAPVALALTHPAAQASAALTPPPRPAQSPLPLPPAAAPPRIKIATWNLEWLNSADNAGAVKRNSDDYARLKKYADRLDADVVAFQEVDGETAAARVFDPSRYTFFVAHQNNPQLTGFAVKRALRVTRNPDFAELDVGSVRAGTDITVQLGERSLRLLSVHLKSGCFDQALNSSTNACTKLSRQLPILEQWIDDRAAEHQAAIVLGDFNRRFFKSTSDPFWVELDDATPAASDLSSPTEGQTPQCWNGQFDQFIDHIVFNKPASTLLVAGSFAQHVYDASDAQHKAVLSDHCALSASLTGTGVAGVADVVRPAPPVQLPTPDAPSGRAPSAPSAPSACVVKGNINSRRAKLYHVAGCPSYEATVIDDAKGERCFASEHDAAAAGWSKAGNCP